MDVVNLAIRADIHICHDPCRRWCIGASISQSGLPTGSLHDPRVTRYRSRNRAGIENLARPYRWCGRAPFIWVLACLRGFSSVRLELTWARSNGLQRAWGMSRGCRDEAWRLWVRRRARHGRVIYAIRAWSRWFRCLHGRLLDYRYDAHLDRASSVGKLRDPNGESESHDDGNSDRPNPPAHGCMPAMGPSGC